MLHWRHVGGIGRTPAIEQLYRTIGITDLISEAELRLSARYSAG